MKLQFKRLFSVDSPKAIKAKNFRYLNAINYMAPHKSAGTGNLCSHASPGCIALCLGRESGQASMVSAATNWTNNVRDSRERKARYFMQQRQKYMVEMLRHIAADRRADQTTAQARRPKSFPIGRTGERTCAGNPHRRTRCGARVQQEATHIRQAAYGHCCFQRGGKAQRPLVLAPRTISTVSRRSGQHPVHLVHRAREVTSLTSYWSDKKMPKMPKTLAAAFWRCAGLPAASWTDARVVRRPNYRALGLTVY